MANLILSELLEYDPTSCSGLRWKVNRRAVKAGDVAGGLNKENGYYHVRIGKSLLRAHRIIWSLHHGEIPEGLEVDHIDGSRINNQLENLRLASKAENQWNAKKLRTNTSGVKGLSYEGSRDRWIGQVIVNGKLFSKKSKQRDKVEAWLIEFREKSHGEFARHQ